MKVDLNCLKKRISMQYGIEVNDIESSSSGVGSLTYFITDGRKKYVVKFPAENNMNDIDSEPIICEYLLSHNLPVCKFIKNKQGQMISTDENGRKYSIQEFIEGEIYKYNEVPENIMLDAINLLANIHKVLKYYPKLQTGIGADFFKYRTIKKSLESHKASLKKAILYKDYDTINLISSNIEILERFPNLSFNIDMLTMSNTHGDFMPSQLLCQVNHINGVIDWTSACVHPIIWEIMRFYIYSSPECKDGCIDIPKFIKYIKEYLKIQPLNQYDLISMGKLFFYFTAVCDFYGQYYDTPIANRNIFLKQAVLSSKLLKWFDTNIDDLTDALTELI